MRRVANTIVLGLAVAIVCLGATPMHAQVTVSPTIRAKPLHTPQIKPVKAKFEVMHMLPGFIQVRSMNNATEVHNFTYADAIRAQMQQMVQTGGYQYGDKVTIVYWPDKQVALKITGKRSKPS
jgi:hypothetical protein